MDGWMDGRMGGRKMSSHVMCVNRRQTYQSHKSVVGAGLGRPEKCDGPGQAGASILDM